MAICFIILPHIFAAIAKNGKTEQRQRAIESIALSEKIRQEG